MLYRFNVLPGDANQSASVSISDLAGVAATFGAVAGGSSYSVLRDVNGSGTISISDLAIVASAFGPSLPAGNPLGSRRLLQVSILYLTILTKIAILAIQRTLTWRLKMSPAV